MHIYKIGHLYYALLRVKGQQGGLIATGASHYEAITAVIKKIG